VSFLLDPPALLIIGFIAGKAYYLMMAFGDRIFTRGSSKRNLLIFGVVVVLVFWAYSSLLYLDVIYFPWPFPRWYGGIDWMLNSGLPLGLTRTSSLDVVGAVIFATYPIWFYIGTELALAGRSLTRARRQERRNQIIEALAQTAFPKGGAIPPGAADVGTAAVVESLFTKIPGLYEDALTLILFVFDSRLFVLAFTGKLKRFTQLDSDKTSTFGRRGYMQVWESNPFLLSITQVLRILVSYGYYTRPAVYTSIGFNGPLEPNLPPWYNPGPSAASTGGPVSR
jgi:hypothetical protein